MVPLQCLWHDSVTLISTLLLTTKKIPLDLFQMTLSDLAKYSMTWSIAQSFCDSWASCLTSPSYSRPETTAKIKFKVIVHKVLFFSRMPKWISKSNQNLVYYLSCQAIRCTAYSYLNFCSSRFLKDCMALASKVQAFFLALRVSPWP